ncbi:MAG: hypothetical protein GXP04_08405 [Alphaproteobacteria bacterium]|nr:hypothetical protein [Alphaproteobacteria bacterium]
MKFGYVWRGSGAISEKGQRETLSAYGVAKARLTVETTPARDERDKILRILRPGDEFCAYSAAYIADDIVELHQILAAVGTAGALVHLIDFGKSFTGDWDMARITEDYVGVKRKEQTKSARERLKKLPTGKRGGRPKRILTAVEILEFTEQWENEFCSIGMMSRHFKCSKKKVSAWAAELGLGEKAR